MNIQNIKNELKNDVHCANQQPSWWSVRAPQPAHPHQSQSVQPAQPAQNQQRMSHSCKIRYA